MVSAGLPLIIFSLRKSKARRGGRKETTTKASSYCRVLVIETMLELHLLRNRTKLWLLAVCVCASVGNMKYPRCIDLSSTSAVCATNEE